MAKAVFIPRPRNAEELKCFNYKMQFREYSVVEKLRLSLTDYENFCADMQVQREFLAGRSEKCACGMRWSCLLVCTKKRSGGVLVIPREDGSTAWAAYVVHRQGEALP